MRRIILLFAVFITVTLSSGFAQNVGLYGGANISNMTFKQLGKETTKESLWGYTGGLGIEHILIDETLYLQTNLEGVSKGFMYDDKKTKLITHNGQALLGPKGKLRFMHTNSIYAGVYGYIGYAFFGKDAGSEMTFGNGQKSPADMNGLDYGGIFDVGISISLFHMGFRHNIGLADVSNSKNTSDFSKKHASNTFYVAVYFSND